MTVFADTFYYLALVNPHDEAHARSVATARAQTIRIITTAWVLVELAGTLSKPPSRAVFANVYHSLRADALTEIVPADPALLDAGLDLFLRRPDKAWSLTDCISFVVMERQYLKDALTHDHHFEQAGFVALLK